MVVLCFLFAKKLKLQKKKAKFHKFWLLIKLLKIKIRIFQWKSQNIRVSMLVWTLDNYPFLIFPLVVLTFVGGSLGCILPLSKQNISKYSSGVDPVLYWPTRSGSRERAKRRSWSYNIFVWKIKVLAVFQFVVFCTSKITST